MSTAAAAITAPELGLPEHWERDHDRTLQLLERTLALSRILTARASTGEHGRAALAGQHAAEAAARAQPLPSGWAGLHDNPLFAEPSDSSNSGRSMIAAAEAPMTERGGHNECVLHESGKYSTWVELSDDDALVGASRAELESSARSRATAHPSHSSTLQSSSTARDLHIAAPRQDTLCADVDTIQQAKEALRGLNDLSGFEVARDKDGLLVHYRHEPGTTVHSVRFESDFDFPAEQLLALAREFDTVKLWNKFMTESVILSDVSPAEVWAYAAVWLPFPFSQRDLIMHCRGVDLFEEEGCFVVMCDSPEDMDPAAAAAIPGSAGSRERVRNLPGSCIKLTPMPPSADGQSRCHAAMIVHNDPNMPHVPGFLVNFALNVLSPFVYHKIQSVLQDAFCGSGKLAKLLQHRLKTRAELYDTIRDGHVGRNALRHSSHSNKFKMPDCSSNEASENDAEDGHNNDQTQRLPARLLAR